MQPADVLRILALGACALLAVPSARAATYHVAAAGSDGSGDGSAGSPWATITHAVNTVPDESLILVGPGTYTGQVSLSREFAVGITVRSQVPYQARLRNHGTVIKCFYGKGIAVEGFDIAHDGPGSGGLVIQIQDLIGPAGGADYVSRITLRDNVLHDSYNNDILKINNGCGDILVEGNLFYNQEGSDEHIDVNSVHHVTIQDNVFFNDFAGSGRSDTGTSSFVVIKDSNGSSDGILGSSDVTVRRNVFLHWEGSSGQGYVRCGEDATANHEAVNVLIENNLLLGDNTQQIRSPFQVMGCAGITIRANTVVGNQPAKEFGCRVFTVSPNPDNDGVHLHNNVWCDPTGTMGDTFNRGGNTVNLSFDNNLFWNAGNPFPTSGESLIEVADDAHRVTADPLIPAPAGIVLPRWNQGSGLFADGSATIRDVFVNLVESHGTPAEGSPAVDAADPAWSPDEDILGRPRPSGSGPDIGAVERQDATGLAGPGLAAGFRVLPPAPNPARRGTTFRYRATTPVSVALRVLDARGRLVRALPVLPAAPGTWDRVWDGLDDRGARAPGGVYFLHVAVDGRPAAGHRFVLLGD